MIELNKLYNMDYIEGIKNIDDNSIDLILTDIPYNISKTNNFETMKIKRTGVHFGEWDINFNEDNLYLLERLIKKGGSLLIFHSMEQFLLLKNIFKNLTFKDRIIWEKTNPMPRNRNRRWISNTEIISWYVKDNKWTFNRQNEKYESSILKYPIEKKRYHPTQKNLKMIEYLLKIHSNENDIILDPFIGGGTTAIACINNNRNYIGFELNPEYYEIANKRIRRN